MNKQLLGQMGLIAYGQSVGFEYKEASAKKLLLSDVVVTDGDIGIGLSYDPNGRKDSAPVIVGNIRLSEEKAYTRLKKKKIPIWKDSTLTRFLNYYKNSQEEIPVDLFQPVAAIYARIRDEQSSCTKSREEKSEKIS